MVGAAALTHQSNPPSGYNTLTVWKMNFVTPLFCLGNIGKELGSKGGAIGYTLVSDGTYTTAIPGHLSYLWAKRQKKCLLSWPGNQYASKAGFFK